MHSGEEEWGVARSGGVVAPPVGSGAEPWSEMKTILLHFVYQITAFSE